MAQLNDASYKQLYSNPELVRDLVTGFTPYPWLHRLDFSTLQRMPCAYVGDDLRQRFNDLVWRVKADGEWIYLFLMIEIQSRVDRYMAVRMLAYVGQLYQRLYKEAEALPDGRLPPVLPIVFYNGTKPWNAATRVEQLVPWLPADMARYQPRMDYLLVESRHCAEAADLASCNLAGMAALLQHTECPDTVLALCERLDAALEGKEHLKQVFNNYCRGVIACRTQGVLDLTDVSNLREMKMALSTGFKLLTVEEREALLREGMREGERRGKQEGLLKGEARVVELQLRERFGDLPADVLARLQNADVAHLEHWSRRLLTAPVLDDVFADN